LKKETLIMFVRFFRGDKARMDAKGTGLGLSISKRIIELHHVDLRAVYKDSWITFIVMLPIEENKLMKKQEMCMPIHLFFSLDF